MGTPKRLYWDIETSPNIGMFWAAGWKLNIDYSNIIKERAIICICYKWEGQRKVHSLQWDSKQCDKKMLLEFVRVAKEADELVGHNGDKFDLAWLRTRCLFHRIDMFPSYQTIDTLKISRSKFRFNSNRLNYIADFLGVGNKHHTTFNLWKDVILHSSDKAMRQMVAYCKQDVKLLEMVYKELSNHVESKIHHGVLEGSHKDGCPECGSLDLIKARIRATLTGRLKRTFRCVQCGKYHTKTVTER